MVSIDARFPATLPATPAAAGWWHRPRWLLLPLALPACIVVGLAVGTLINLALTGTLGGEAGGGVLAPSAVAADHSALVAPEVCQRMHQIVDTACSQIGRAHVCTPVTNAQLVCRLLLEKKTPHHYTHITL